ncbi:2888_t:CDS:2, partial [Funneliformis caledonium]
TSPLHNSTITEIGIINSDAGTINTGTINTELSTRMSFTRPTCIPKDDEEGEIHSMILSQFTFINTIVGGKSTDWIDGFLSSLDESIVEQMRIDIGREK